MNDARGTLTYIAPVFRVADLKRSLAFHRDQLGFGLDFTYEEFCASVSRDGCRVHLKCADPTPRDQAAFEGNEFIDACVVLQNVEGLSATFQSAGITIAVPLRQMPYGVEFYIRARTVTLWHSFSLRRNERHPGQAIQDGPLRAGCARSRGGSTCSVAAACFGLIERSAQERSPVRRAHARKNGGTARAIRGSFDRLARATRAVADPSVSF
jgi:hypothetical protein